MRDSLNDRRRKGFFVIDYDFSNIFVEGSGGRGGGEDYRYFRR